MVEEVITVPQLAYVKDWAVALNTTEPAVRWMLHKGDLPPAARINGRLTWKASQIAEYLEAKFAEATN